MYVTPYKFELHAGGRTKHPNACIYFENGKTVHEVFQQLRDTPEHMLFDAIPRIAGSAVSRLHFHLWKGHSHLQLLSSAPSLD
ncbi:ADF-H domain-containing protein [Psidium guajava]|nr:ADF-H domain-containing protein [Psidium guajava]